MTYILISIYSPQDEWISHSNMDHTSVYCGGKRMKRWKELRDEKRKGGDKKTGWRTAWGEKRNMTEMKRSRKWHCSFKGRCLDLMQQQFDGWTLQAGPDGLEKSVMTSSWQHHPNLFLIYTLHIMHSYNMTWKNKRLKRTGMIRGYSRRWRNEKYAYGFPSEQKNK